MQLPNSATITTTSNTTNGWQVQQPWQQLWNGVSQQYDYDEQARRSAAEQVAAMYRYANQAVYVQPQQPQKEQEPVRGLFEVFVVNPESGEIVKRDVVVADSDKKAELKVMRAIDVDPDDVDIIVRRLGDVRPKRKVQEVKVIKE
jgi:hypothetical protein